MFSSSLVILRRGKMNLPGEEADMILEMAYYNKLSHNFHAYC